MNSWDILNDLSSQVNTCVTNKHSSTGYIFYTGESGDRFTLDTEEKLHDFFNWNENFNTFIDPYHPRLLISRKDENPVGTTGQMFAKLYSGQRQRIHGCPLSSMSVLPNYVIPVTLTNNGWFRI